MKKNKRFDFVIIDHLIVSFIHLHLIFLFNKHLLSEQIELIHSRFLQTFNSVSYPDFLTK